MNSCFKFHYWRKFPVANKMSLIRQEVVQQQQIWKIFHLDDKYLGHLDCSYFGLDVFRSLQSQSLVIFSSSVLFHICRFLDVKLLRKIECCFKTVPVLTAKPQTKMSQKHAHFSSHPRTKAQLLFSVMFLTLTLSAANFFTFPSITVQWNLVWIQCWHCSEQEMGPSLRKGHPEVSSTQIVLRICVINHCGWQQ